MKSDYIWLIPLGPAILLGYIAWVAGRLIGYLIRLFEKEENHE